MLVILVALPLLLPGPNLWADDDAIMDVDDNAASFIGTWPRSTFRILYYGDDYQYAVGSGGAPTASATFTTAKAADITGRYQVYVRWTAGTARATNARYNIYDDTNVSKGFCTYDQRFNGGVWMFCAEVTLDADRRGRVIINNANVPTNRYVCADAVRFVRVSKDKNDIVDEPGIDYANQGGLSNTLISTNCSAQTNLAFQTLTAPASGYVVVLASGVVENTTADRWVRPCISDSSGGGDCDSLTPVIENTADERNAGNYADERRFALQQVYSVGAGTRTYFLKACRQDGATGRIWWDDLVIMYFPSRF